MTKAAFIVDPRNNRYQASAATLKEMLNLPKKLGPAPLKPTFIGLVHNSDGGVYPIWDMPKGTNGKKGKRAHRLHVRIGKRFIPAGRMHQVHL